MNKEPYWKDHVLYVWDDRYKGYIANFCPPLFIVLSCGGWEEYKKFFNMEYEER